MSKDLYRSLDFPLNVYAYALHLQQGQVNYLHYGLVAEDESAWEIGAKIAQQRLTDLLFKYLPPAPCRLLDIGVGLGTTAAILIARGYIVTAISPDAQQINLSQAHLVGKGQLQCVTFEAFTAPPQSYDIILFQESAQYLKTLTLFNKAHRLLAERGQLLIVDEVSLRRTPDDTSVGLPFLKYTLAHAQRCGFKLIEQLDLSKQAEPTVDYLLQIVETYRAQLLTDLTLSETKLESLLNKLKVYQQRYRDSRYGYRLLLFEKMQAPRWQLTEVSATDYSAVSDLFAEVFNQTLSQSLWQWKYGENRGMAIVAWQDGKIVAHYGGVVRALSYFGTAKRGVQIVDVMVAKVARRALTRQGAYFLVGATFPEYYAGYGAPILLGYGFPTQRAMETAERLGLYAEVGKMVEIRWTTQAGHAFFRSHVRHLRAREKKPLEILWQQMRADFPQAILGVRDWSYIQHRYLAHPQRHYEILLISQRFSTRPLGIVVLQRRQETCHLLDIIAPLSQMPLIIQQMQRTAGNWGLSTLALWITENFATTFTSLQGTLHPLDIRIPHCIWYEGPPLEAIKEKWWLMGGDTDFL